MLATRFGPFSGHHQAFQYKILTKEDTKKKIKSKGPFDFSHCSVTMSKTRVKVKVKVKQSLYRPGVAQRVPGS